jgi:hypothetical protein
MKLSTLEWNMTEDVSAILWVLTHQTWIFIQQVA